MVDGTFVSELLAGNSTLVTVEIIARVGRKGNHF
jgi:hypothetical protein